MPPRPETASSPAIDRRRFGVVCFGAGRGGEILFDPETSLQRGRCWPIVGRPGKVALSLQPERRDADQVLGVGKKYPCPCWSWGCSVLPNPAHSMGSTARGRKWGKEPQSKGANWASLCCFSHCCDHITDKQQLTRAWI